MIRSRSVLGGLIVLMSKLFFISRRMPHQIARALTTFTVKNSVEGYPLYRETLAQNPNTEHYWLVRGASKGVSYSEYVR